MDSPGGPFFTSDSSVGRAGDCSDHYFAALTNPLKPRKPPQVAGSIPAQKNFPRWSDSSVG